MQIQTIIPIQEAKHKFGYDDKVLFLGSCFAENIGNQMDYYKFQTVINPYGILFHPLALERILYYASNDEGYGEETIFDFNGVWKSFVAHSYLNSTSRGAIIDKLKNAQIKLQKSIREASHIFITLGTAWVYQHTETGIAVANCHKVPQKAFAKGILPIPEIKDSLTRQCTLIKAMNPGAQIIFTISPVRHIKDGFVENMRSKAHLISAVQEVCITESAAYFPAYEIMMDELRDYRFYAEDMIHPSSLAIDYLWERFVKAYVLKKAETTMEKVESVQKALTHKPFDTKNSEYKKHIHRVQVKIEELQSSYPHMIF